MFKVLLGGVLGELFGGGLEAVRSGNDGGWFLSKNERTPITRTKLMMRNEGYGYESRRKRQA